MPPVRLIAVGALSALGLSCAGAAALVQEGDGLAAAGKNDAAVTRYMQALDEDPEFIDAHNGLARVYLATGRLEEADQALDRAERIDRSMEVLRIRGLVRFSQRKYSEAAKLLDEVITENPDSPTLHVVLGRIRKDAMDLERAVESFEMALTLDPKRADAHLELADALKRLGRYQDALDVLETGRKIIRGKSRASLNVARGGIYEKMGMADYAVNSYKQALKSMPKNTAAIAGLARGHRLAERYAEAIELLQGATAENPDDLALNLELGISLKEFRMADQAVPPLLRALQIDAGKEEIYKHLLPLLEEDEESKEQLFIVLQKGALARPDDLDIQLKLGRLADEREDPVLVIEAMERALELDPGNPEVFFLRGTNRARSGEIDLARDDLDALRLLDGTRADKLQETINTAQQDALSGDNKDVGRKKKKKKRGKRRKKKKKR